MTTITAAAFTESEAIEFALVVIEQTLRALADPTNEEMMTKCLEAVRPAIVAFGKLPMSISVDWPAELTEEACASLEAQVRERLVIALRERIAFEFAELVLTPPRLIAIIGGQGKEFAKSMEQGFH